MSGLGGRLARSGVLIVADYLGATPVDGPVDFTSAGHYYATLLRPIRRGADDAKRGIRPTSDPLTPKGVAKRGLAQPGRLRAARAAPGQPRRLGDHG